MQTLALHLTGELRTLEPTSWLYGAFRKLHRELAREPMSWSSVEPVLERLHRSASFERGLGLVGALSGTSEHHAIATMGWRGTFLAGLGRWKEAASALENAPRTEAGGPNVAIARGEIEIARTLLARARWVDAESFLRRAEGRAGFDGPTAALVLLMRAREALGKGQLRAARSLAATAATRSSRSDVRVEARWVAAEAARLGGYRIAAIRIGEAALERARVTGLRSLEGDLLVSVGASYGRESPALAEAHFREALRIAFATSPEGRLADEAYAGLSLVTCLTNGGAAFQRVLAETERRAIGGENSRLYAKAELARALDAARAPGNGFGLRRRFHEAVGTLQRLGCLLEAALAMEEASRLGRLLAPNESRGFLRDALASYEELEIVRRASRARRGMAA